MIYDSPHRSYRYKGIMKKKGRKKKGAGEDVGRYDSDEGLCRSHWRAETTVGVGTEERDTENSFLSFITARLC